MGICVRCCCYLPAIILLLGFLNAVLQPPPARVSLPQDGALCETVAPEVKPTFVRSSADFDVILYGATGFTGKLAAFYLLRAPGKFSYAIAGRSKSKLEALAKELKEAADAAGHPRKPAGVIVADSSDGEALTKMARRARVVLAGAGPYAQHGTRLLEACAKEGTHYVDMSGETKWQRDMIDKYHDVARNSGAKVVIAGGLDSVPFDVGAALALSELEKVTKRVGGAATVRSVLTGMCGAVSGTTLQSGFDDDAALKTAPSTWADDPYLLSPQVKCKVDSVVTGWGASYRYDRTTGQAAMPFVMAVINARIVRRSLELMGRRNVSYGEGMTMGSLGDSLVCLAPFVLSGEVNMAPKPGEGPHPRLQEVGYYKAEITASDDATGKKVQLAVEGLGDPGYRHTSKLWSEVGLCLADSSCHRKGMGGGVLTPASATDLLRMVQRLKETTHEDGRALLTYTLKETSGKSKVLGEL